MAKFKQIKSTGGKGMQTRAKPTKNPAPKKAVVAGGITEGESQQPRGGG